MLHGRHGTSRQRGLPRRQQESKAGFQRLCELRLLRECPRDSLRSDVRLRKSLESKNKAELCTASPRPLPRSQPLLYVLHKLILLSITLADHRCLGLLQISDILLPPLSVLFPLHKNLDEKFAVLRRGPKYEQLHGYNTLELARSDGAVILAYGSVPSPSHLNPPPSH